MELSHTSSLLSFVTGEEDANVVVVNAGSAGAEIVLRVTPRWNPFSTLLYWPLDFEYR